MAKRAVSGEEVAALEELRELRLRHAEAWRELRRVREEASWRPEDGAARVALAEARVVEMGRRLRALTDRLREMRAASREEMEREEARARADRLSGAGRPPPGAP